MKGSYLGLTHFRHSTTQVSEQLVIPNKRPGSIRLPFSLSSHIKTCRPECLVGFRTPSLWHWLDGQTKQNILASQASIQQDKMNSTLPTLPTLPTPPHLSHPTLPSPPHPPHLSHPLTLATQMMASPKLWRLQAPRGRSRPRQKVESEAGEKQRVA